LLDNFIDALCACLNTPANAPLPVQIKKLRSENDLPLNWGATLVYFTHQLTFFQAFLPVMVQKTVANSVDTRQGANVY
jgi:hypothetical protein